jgi:fructose-bisphosphate aldolase class II
VFRLVTGEYVSDLLVSSYFSYLVFHGGSGSSAEEIKTGVNNGVVKMNVDTDTQFAYLAGIRVSTAPKL